jgi:hypothetical protein
MRVVSLLVYPPVMSRWLPALVIVTFTALLLVVALLALAGGDASALPLTQVPDEPTQPFRWT